MKTGMHKLISLVLIFLLLASGAFSAEIPENSAAPQASPEPVVKPDILNLGGYLVLVNRDNRISRTYEPEDLVLPKVETRKKSLQERIYLRQDAASALEQMFAAALNEKGYILYATSGYRSFGIQQILFNAKVEEVGSKSKAQYRVAPAGTSEHQLGLAMDIQAPSHLNLSQAFGDTEEGKWAGENAHRFGYILRYKTEWRDITGISDEPWHFRYVGIAHATAMFELDMPLETYVSYLEKLPEYVLTRGSHPLLTGLVSDLMNERQPQHLDLLFNTQPGEEEAALKLATEPYLQDGLTYEQAMWYAYPTPKPTAAPWVDTDEEVEVSGSKSGL